ncbi:MAG: hypothetical protein ABI181_08965 [Mycobacteriaceae bacterium]
MAEPRGSRVRRVAALTLAALLATLVTGCSGSGGASSLVTVTPAAPATAPPTQTTPAGTVRPLSADVRGTVLDPRTRTLVLLVGAPERLLLLDADNFAATPRTVALPSVAAQVTLAGAGGSVLLATDGAVLRVDTRSGAVSRIPVSGDVTAVLQLRDGAVVAGLRNGTTDVLGPDGAVRATVPGLARVDELVQAGDALLALDRAQSALAVLKPDQGRLGLELRAGNGATNAVADSYGRVLVTNTRDGELLAFSGDPLILRQRYPVAGSPYALAFDARTNIVWVTLSATNQLLGYDVRGGEPTLRYTFATVAQPYSVAVDEQTGAVLVSSAAGAGVQRIVPTEVAK